ncbi:hypothetical protein D1007_15517 [Hordeum vulgare]|nr:hypothetical protein D1007_15517 [Hordeum vulgare]
MYYVKGEEIGNERLKYLGNEASVHEMLEVYHHVKVVNIKVVRDVQPKSSTQANENYMNTQERCSLNKVVEQSELQNQINDRKPQLERSRIQREVDLNHFEGDTEVSEFCFDDSVHSDGSGEAVQMEIECASKEDRALELTAVVKHVKNPGPTSRCLNEVEHKQIQDWYPEADEFCFACDLGISDEEEEDEVELPYLLKKPKSNNKMMKDRFREALRDFHIRTLSGALHGQSGHCSKGSGPYWVHEGRVAEVELDISPKVAGEEEAQEWLLSSPEKKKQRRG